MKKLLILPLVLLASVVLAQSGSIEKGDTTIYKPDQNGVSVFSYDKKFGLIDSFGNVILDSKFNELSVMLYKDGELQYRLFEDEKGEGVIRVDLSVLIPSGIYDEILLSNEGFFRVKKNGKLAFVNAEGVLISDWFDDAQYFWNGFAKVKVGKKYGFIGKDGKYIADPKYKAAMRFDENGMAAVSESGKYWGYIDSSGNEAIEVNYKKVNPFHDGLASVSEDGKTWTFINTKGAEMIDREFAETKNFHNGLCAVKVDGKWGYIDKSGNTMIPFEYESAGDFDMRGIAAVKKDNRYFFINKSNERAFEGDFHNVAHFIYNDLSIRVKDGIFSSWYSIDHEGKRKN